MTADEHEVAVRPLEPAAYISLGKPARRVEVGELAGADLDLVVARLEWPTTWSAIIGGRCMRYDDARNTYSIPFSPTSNPSDAVPLLDRCRISLQAPDGPVGQWLATTLQGSNPGFALGWADEPMTAAMRALVGSRVGRHVYLST